jgi:hypothetical protein
MPECGCQKANKFSKLNVKIISNHQEEHDACHVLRLSSKKISKYLTSGLDIKRWESLPEGDDWFFRQLRFGKE